MVNRAGQTMTEFVIVLSLLTIIGAFLAKTLMGPNQSSGAIGAMQGTAIKRIANDKD